MKGITYLFFVTLFYISFVSGQDRKLSSKLNPGCINCSADTTLVYIKAKGSNDTIHQIWDFTKGIPTMIFLIAGVNSNLTVGWVKSTPTWFLITDEPTYSFATAFDKIYEYNDLEDRGYIANNSNKHAYHLNNVNWNRTDMVLSETEIMLHMKTVNWTLGTVEIKIDLLPFVAYGPQLPHLVHSSNSSLVDVSLANLTMSRRYNSSRFALHVVLASTDHDGYMRKDEPQSLDDEHTPGVFKVVEIRTPRTVQSGSGGFLQFRPVAYTERVRTITSATFVHVPNFSNTTVELPRSSTMETFFNNINWDHPLVQDMYVSFGMPGDGFYNKTNYTSWSYTIGYGAPPVEGFSLFVILVITLGVGVPVVLTFSGIVYLLVRRYKQTNRPERLREEQ